METFETATRRALTTTIAPMHTIKDRCHSDRLVNRLRACATHSPIDFSFIFSLFACHLARAMPVDNSHKSRKGASKGSLQAKTSGASVVAGTGSKQSMDGSGQTVKYFPSAVNLGLDKESVSCQSQETDKATRASAPKGDTEQYNSVTDIVAVGLLCNIHRRVALTEMDNNRGLFFPWKPFDSTKDGVECSLNELIRKMVDVQSVKFRTLVFTSHDRVQVPKSDAFVNRFFYRVDVANGPNVTSGVCVCEHNHKQPLVWLTLDEINQRMATLAGPEPKFVFDQLTEDAENRRRGKTKYMIPPIVGRFTLERTVLDAIGEYGGESKSAKRQLVECGGLGWTDIVSLYNEFTIHCFPSNWMTQRTLARFLFSKLAVTRVSVERLHKYFRSFDLSKRTYLSFGDLLQGLAMFKEAPAHCSICCHDQCNQNRYEYLFRFFSSSWAKLSREDLCELVLSSEGKQTDPANISATETQVEAVANKYQLNLLETSTGVNYEHFLTLVKNEFPMASLFRSLEMDIKLTLISLAPKPDKPSASQYKAIRQWTNSYQKCDSCTRITKHYLGMHIISLTEIGEVGDINKLEPNAKRIPAQEFRHDIRESNAHVLANDLIDRIKRVAAFIFNPEEMAAAGNANLIKQVDSWFFPSKSDVLKYVVFIAQKAEEIFATEDRVVHVSSPVYCFGDIHGNLHDLLTFAQNLWKTSPFINQGKYLFLGDFIDRGVYGVECITYLFCMKILAPRNFILTRGNHEIRDVQEQFSFYRECTTRFNLEVWEAINSAFDRLPLAAVVDECIYGAHGGIPTSVGTIDRIRAAASPLDQPQINLPEAWEILWNDPISQEEFLRLSEFDQKLVMEQAGFARNTKRGTAFWFTRFATQRFFARNNVQFILRGHEVYEPGYHFHHDGDVITVFSCSKYLGLNNRAAVLFLDGHKIRVVQIVTEE